MPGDLTVEGIFDKVIVATVIPVLIGCHEIYTPGGGRPAVESPQVTLLGTHGVLVDMEVTEHPIHVIFTIGNQAQLLNQCAVFILACSLGHWASVIVVEGTEPSRLGIEAGVFRDRIAFVIILGGG